MVTKKYSRNGLACQVHFELPASVAARQAVLFVDIDPVQDQPRKMKPLKGGGFSLSLSLAPGHSYRFHYILDGSRWLSDPADDKSIPNVFGIEESIVKV